MVAEILLGRLTKVRRNGDMKWTACCPAHEDRNPSLAIKELSDGRLLIRCFAGCGAADIMEAAGLTLADLYPDGELEQWMRTGGRKRYTERKQASTVYLEQQVIEIAKCDRIKGKRLNKVDLAREREAFIKLRQMGAKPL